jgi:hypothetical protein
MAFNISRGLTNFPLEIRRSVKSKVEASSKSEGSLFSDSTCLRISL